MRSGIGFVFNGKYKHSVHPPPFCWGVEPPTKFSKRGGLTGPQLWEGVAGKEEVTFFRGVAIFRKKKNN